MRELSFYAYETYCMVRIEDGPRAGSLLTECHNIARQVERTLNMYDEASELSVLCRSYQVNQPYEVSALLLDFLEISLHISRLSEGAFDPTVGTVVREWGIGSGRDRILMGEELSALCARTGYRHIRLLKEKQAVMIDTEGILLDSGAIGKGIAIDQILRYLKNNHVKYACLDFGGNLYVLGATYKIGIRQPEDEKSMMAVVPVRDCAISTSSWYEHCFKSGDSVYGHVIDPLNGKPAKSDFSSVTVICENAIYADALSTALYVLGEKRGEKLLHSLWKESGIYVSGVAKRLRDGRVLRFHNVS